MAWIYLLLAAGCEMAWPLGFKYTNGFKAHYWAVGVTMAMMLLSFWLMSRAEANGIHVGTAYAVWTGLGTAGTVVLGIILFREPGGLLRLGCLTLILVGAVGLKLFSPPGDSSASVAGASGGTARGAG